MFKVMRILDYIKIFGIFLAIGIVFLNLKLSKRIFFGYKLLENPADKDWEKILEISNKKERIEFFKCCAAHELQEKIIIFENKKKERIGKMEYALNLNPYEWRLILEIADFYRKEGDFEKANFWDNKIKELVPKTIIKSFLREP